MVVSVITTQQIKAVVYKYLSPHDALLMAHELKEIKSNQSYRDTIGLLIQILSED